MKKILIFILFIIMIIIFLSKEKTEVKEIKGVFISYIDYVNLKGKEKYEIKHEIDKMIDNISSFGLNSIILQVSSFNDAIYNSSIYLSSHKVVEKEGDILPLDILDYFIKKSKEKNIKIYAWINPFRIRNNNNLDSLNKSAYYYKWVGTNKIEISENGIYLNPAEDEVISYITLAIKEICENYDVSGVLFDDYYYPTKTIDLKNYEKENNSISLKDYRINNINKLIKESYKTVKSVNKNIKFGLSPSGNIENNLNNEYLDIENILKNGYIDFVIPQLYYGFENTNKPYLETLKNWSNISLNTDFFVALSLYKSGETDNFAINGKNEWLENSDIIKRQIIESRKIKNYKGFYIYRYEYLFNIDKSILNEEVKNIKSITVN